MKRRKIGTFEDLLALDPKEWKFSRVLSSDESRKAIEDSKKPLSLRDSYDNAKAAFEAMRAEHNKKKVQ
jgi:hypothetical protein